MQEFEIEIKEVLSRVEKIEANNLGEAIDRAMELYYGEKIILYPEDHKSTDFAPYVNQEKSR
ncbi:DpnD/PcfM family protein [Lachnotalea glycerini]|uniref:DpnD protein n=1 Tax=Lachnotalea glycerini TaxID=1763509 RepID=A0A371JBP3_9FIRM|nr:DpnD/PcfM family protein [Lachnotalea glycerini]RDY30143.1 DpnD protein [Lachnotalea glycerini]